MQMMTSAPFEPAGIRHATINGHRFHLRLSDPMALNPLWIDGKAPLYVDQVAAQFISHLIDAMWQFQQGDGDESKKVIAYVVEKMYDQYHRFSIFPWKRVTRNKIQNDLNRLFGLLMRISEGHCPVEEGLAGMVVRPSQWAAPARMDMALTYRCNLQCGKCYRDCSGENDGAADEMKTEDWIAVIKRLWHIGIPNLVFTGGEPTLREDLIRLIDEAKEFVTGLVTNGTMLSAMAESLKNVSLDYIQVSLESYIPDVHNQMVGAESNAFEATVKGIQRAVDVGLYVSTNTTLTLDNFQSFAGLIRFARDLGLHSMSCNTLICSGRGIREKEQKGLNSEQLKRTLVEAVKVASESQINLEWYSPSCYLHLNPIELGLGAKGCSAAAYNMTVQPDGSVLPCQSWPDSVGHILHDSWDAVWNHPTCKKLREHGFAKDRQECTQCVHNQICGGGCPLERSFE
jgi:radical SAM protein with 4Fe4S-binding SPASM domain